MRVGIFFLIIAFHGFLVQGATLPNSYDDLCRLYGKIRPARGTLVQHRIEVAKKIARGDVVAIDEFIAMDPGIGQLIARWENAEGIGPADKEDILQVVRGSLVIAASKYINNDATPFNVLANVQVEIGLKREFGVVNGYSGRNHKVVLIPEADLAEPLMIAAAKAKNLSEEDSGENLLRFLQLKKLVEDEGAAKIKDLFKSEKAKKAAQAIVDHWLEGDVLDISEIAKDSGLTISSVVHIEQRLRLRIRRIAIQKGYVHKDKLPIKYGDISTTKNLTYSLRSFLGPRMLETIQVTFSNDETQIIILNALAQVKQALGLSPDPRALFFIDNYLTTGSYGFYISLDIEKKFMEQFPGATYAECRHYWDKMRDLIRKKLREQVHDVIGQ